MGRSPILFAGRILLLVLCAGMSAHAATPEEIETAVVKAKQWLYSKQNNGNWESVTAPNTDNKSPDGGNFGGTTALVTFSLLCAGDNAQEGPLKNAADFLLTAQSRGVYSVGLRCQALALLPKSPKVLDALLRDSKILLAEAKPNAGYWYSREPLDVYDHSISQFALLGLAAANDVGIEVPDEYWGKANEM